MGSSDTGEECLLVELDAFHGLESQRVVTKESVDTEQANHGEVAKGLVKDSGTVLAGDSKRVLASLDGLNLVVDLGLAGKRVKDVEHAVGTPDFRVLLEQADLVSIVTALDDLASVNAEIVELVNELVNDVPCPVTGELNIDGALGVQNVVEQLAVVFVGLESLLSGGL